MLIYKATNLINNKVYIGQTHKTLEERIKRHKNDYQRRDSYFYRAIRKYGWENFKWEVIDDSAITDEELNKLEKYYIKMYNSFDNKDKGYNSTSGADHNYKLTEEECLKRSLRVRGEKNPMYGKPGIWKGKHFSKEHKQHLSEALKGRPAPWAKGKNHWCATAVINLNTGEIFDTLKQAAEAYSIDYNTISKMLKGQIKNTKGYKWAKVEDIDLNIFKPIPINLDEHILIKPVIHLETGKIYHSTNEVATIFQCAAKTIRECCLCQRPDYNGNHFQYFFKDNTVLSYKGKILPYRKCRDYQETSC